MTSDVELVVLHTRPFIFGKFSVYVGSNPISVHLGQHAFGMPRGVQNEFSPKKTEIGCSSSRFNTLFEHASQQVEINFCFFMQNDQWKTLGDQKVPWP